MSEATPKVPPEEGIDSGRRQFVRKAAYTAPALVALGFAMHSDKAGAQFPPPPSAPASSADKADDPTTEDDLLEEELGRRD